MKTNPYQYKREQYPDPNTEEDKVNYTGRWIVAKREGLHLDSGEISILRSDFKHGKTSYGWDGPMKIILSSSDSFDRTQNRYAKLVWEETLNFAQRLADKLNMIEGRR